MEADEVTARSWDQRSEGSRTAAGFIKSPWPRSCQFAMDKPDLLVEDVRAFARALR